MTKPVFPKPTEFFLSIPLYSKASIEGEAVWAALDVLYYAGTYDTYCTHCKRDSTFQVIAPTRPRDYVRDHAGEILLKTHGMKINLPTVPEGIHTVHACCTRQKAHMQDFLFYVVSDVVFDEAADPKIVSTIEKIGQQPSYGDIHLAKVKKYTHVLSDAQLGEFSRAIGLASHDVGVGSYVYLRRVFESLVEEAHQVARTDGGWDEDAYVRMRMGEKIAALRAHLPTFLVEHPAMYSLLSKGVHELSEEDCLKHFDTLRLATELILDERLEQRDKDKKIAAAEAALIKAVGEAGT